MSAAPSGSLVDAGARLAHAAAPLAEGAGAAAPDYFAQALLAGAVVGALCGLVGVLVLLRRRAFFTMALTHATFPGGVAAAILGVNVVLGAGVMGLALVGLMAWLSTIRRQGRQVAAGVILSFGYALGMVLMSLAPGLTTKVDAFLTGSILSIPPENLLLLEILLGLVVAAYLAFGKELLFSSFDRRGFQAAGYAEGATDLAVLAIIAGTVVAAMPAIGSILAIAMIAAPAAAARLLTRRIGRMLALSVAFGVGAALLGLWASRALDLAAGGAMALAATAIYLLALAASRLPPPGRDTLPREPGAADAAADAAP